MEKKDYFSRQSKEYAAFRPIYPETLYQFIFKNLKHRSCAWDCATGNGQVARYLADHFDSVYATDISQPQLDHAASKGNIFYSRSAAEDTVFQNDQFDLITVAQALHWFNLSRFYEEAKRTLKPQGLLAVWGYGLLTIDPAIDDLFLDFYSNTTGPYWDAARKVVEDHYRNIPFPFEEIHCPEFHLRLQWTPEQFAGYLRTWSAVQKYIAQHHTDPVDALMDKIDRVWKAGEIKDTIFPVFMRLGRISK